MRSANTNTLENLYKRIKKFAQIISRLNAVTIDFGIQMDDSEMNGDPHEQRWGFYDKNGAYTEVVNIHCTNDGTGRPQEIEFRVTGTGLVNGDWVVQNGTLYAISGFASYGGGTLYGTYYFEGPGAVQFDVGVGFNSGFHVYSGNAVFDNSVTCNADFSQTAGYHDIATRPRYTWTETASTGNMDLGWSLFHKITGNTTINRISTDGYVPGCLAILKFESALTITNAAAASGSYKGIKLNGGVAVITANDNIVLMLNEDGTFWEQVGLVSVIG